MDTINSSNSLYKELNDKYHSDRYLNTWKQEVTERIFQEIFRNKRNYGKQPSKYIFFQVISGHTLVGK